ncbi:phage minor head protein [Pedobacter sp.]|uniref:phage minor head protein n=1 Tax=Pedobacter sp. TaxID=1411316 RepID=UPI00396C600F
MNGLGGISFEALSQKVNSYYGCCSASVKLAGVPTDFGDYISQLALKIWNSKQTITTDPVLVQTYGNRLQEALKKGLGINVDFTVRDNELHLKLQQNVWQFSAAKSYTQLKDMSAALLKPDGTLRSFDEFRMQVSTITKQQLTWLKTEYDLAVSGGQMAAKWDQIQKQKDLFPYLQLEAVEDSHTTALCKKLDGTVRHVDDPFWQLYYPPNHYNCRSTVRQLKSGKNTTDDEITYPEIPEMFKVNLGQRGLAFPEDHAYFIDMPKEVMDKSREFFPYNLQFDILHEDLGTVRKHFLVTGYESDYNRIENIAVDKAKQGSTVDIMPTLDPTTYSSYTRDIIFKGGKAGKSPDLRIDGELVEYETVYKTTVRALKGAIESGAAQADFIIVSMASRYDDKVISGIIRQKVKDYPNLRYLEFRYKDQIIMVYKKSDPTK